MANAKGRTTRDVNAALRATQALQLRAQKLGYDETAKRCGYGSRGAAHDAVQRELDRVVVRDIDTLRTEEASMLDVMQAEIWPLMLDRENKGRLFAVDRILQIAERRAKLMGLDRTTGSVAANVVVIREAPAGYLGGVIEGAIE